MHADLGVIYAVTQSYSGDHSRARRCASLRSSRVIRSAMLARAAAPISIAPLDRPRSPLERRAPPRAPRLT